MTRRLLALGLLSFAALAAERAAASEPPTLVRTASSFGVSRPLGDLAALQKSIVRPGPVEWERENRILPRTRLGRPGASADAALQGGPRAPAAMPPATTFEGLSSSNNLAIFGSRPIPPDTVGDVGPNHYVQMVNTLIRVFAKDGTPLTPFFAISDLFATVGPPCAGTNDGDPIVLYDPLADRWLLSQLCGETTAARDHELIAISTTGDPTGTYFVYDFLMPNDKFLDYPHFGVWPDAYYMTENQFIGNTFAGGGAFAFDRTRMVAGDPTASYVYFDEALVAPGVEGQLPSDFDGVVVPPAGTPNLFIDFKADEFGDPADALRIFEFHVDFADPGSSTFTARPDVPLAAFDPRDTAARTAVAQPPPASSADFLDSLAGQMMHRVAYRTLSGGVESFVLNFVVNVSGQNPTGDASKYQAGIRWVELRRNGGTGAVTVNNQGTYAPGSGDGANGRDLWMGSVAQDNQGNIAVGFSASSLTLFPSILYAGRLAGDPAGQLSQGEATLQAGGGSQTSPQSRWGDYSAMTVDPADECTFWYTNEYYAASSTADWKTKIGHFKFSGCTAAGKGVIQGTVTDCDSAAPLPDAILTTPDGYLRASDGVGGYSFTVAPGTYTITVRRPGYADATQMVTVSAGGNVTQDFCLTAIPVLAPAAAALQQEDCPPGNGAIDPGETVTVNLCVANTGAAGTANLVGTLQASGGVTNPGAPQDFGAVAAGGGVVCRPFSFQASGSCGTTLVATLALEDGATSLGTAVFDLPLGAPVVPFKESFDAVAAPALPAGWTASNAAGSVPLWTTSTSNPDTLPNSAFVNDPASVADKRLTSPAFLVQTAGARLSFRHRFDLDEGFDGGVLEVSSPNINGGAFTDVTNAAVGGGFLQGGYATTLATGFGNPIGGRSAWTGTTFAEITTVVDLGPSVAGHTIQLRWRMATDSAFGGGGWWVDSISLADGFDCCALPAFVGEPMSVDGHTASGTVSDVNGVLEPGESVLVSPAWRKTGGGSSALTGSASAFGGPAGATYTIGDFAADYGTVGGAPSDCFSATGDCYRMTVSKPASRPATHWDASFQETLSAGPVKTWTLHVGGSFADVAGSQPFYRKIETLFHSGITSGCGPSTYCPSDSVSRAQMAIFLAKGIAGSGAAVPAGGTLGGSPYFCGTGGVSLFTDVTPTDVFCKHVHFIAVQNVTLGCAASQYCPSDGVSRAQMAAFIARAILAPGGASSVPKAYGPDPVTGLSFDCDAGSPDIHFTDVPAGDPFCGSVHFLWARGIIAGCSATQYCPAQQVTRDQMAKFLSNAFGLQLYGP